MKQMVTDLMIKEWRIKGMPDGRWMKLAERISKKTGCTIDEILVEWESQFEKELARYNK